MRIFYDFELIENGAEHPIIPVSVGMCREDGGEYYAEFADVDWSLANNWVLENVYPLLGQRIETTKSKRQIATEIRDFVGYNPEFWAYYADYDHVLLCSLYGRMIDLPETWPKLTFDIRQYMYHLGLEEDSIQSIQNEGPHDALCDARYDMAAFNALMSYGKDTLK